MQILMWMLLGGLAMRCKGGLLDDLTGKVLSNAIGRSIWAGLITLLALNHGDYLYLFPLIFVMAYIGVAMGYFGQFSLSFPQNRNWKNYALLSLDGAKMMLPVAILFGIFHDNFMWNGVLGAALWPACNLLGVEVYKRWKIMGDTQYGEALLGMCIMGATLWL